MRHYIHATILLVAGCVAAIGLVSCDEDCPVCPSPSAEPVSDYNIYITGTHATMVYVYNTAKKAIIDTIPLGGSLTINDLAVTGDGSRLLLIKNNLIVLDIQTGDTVQVNTDFIKRMGYARIEVSHTGKYIAIFDTEIIAFLDGNTFQVLYTDTLRVHNGRFLPDDSRFYFSRSGASQGYIDLTRNYACSLFTYTDNYGGSPAIWNIQPAQSGTALYMFASYNLYVNWFISYRPEIDSIGVRYRMGLPNGDLRVSPDGKTILASDPGSINLDGFRTEMLIAVDAINDGITVISPGYSSDGSYAVLAGDIVFTPDSRYAVVADEAGLGFALLDIKTLNYIDVQRSPGGYSTMDFVACQKIRDKRRNDKHAGKGKGEI